MGYTDFIKILVIIIYIIRNLESYKLGYTIIYLWNIKIKISKILVTSLKLKIIIMTNWKLHLVRVHIKFVKKKRIIWYFIYLFRNILFSEE